MPLVATAIAAGPTPGWTISIISILIVAAIAWKTFGGRDDLERLRRRLRRRGPGDRVGVRRRRRGSAP